MKGELLWCSNNHHKGLKGNGADLSLNATTRHSRARESIVLR